MRIKELVIDGFKSYPVRTTITGWDTSFNAITGLNGSGKSNILDAITFVLGNTNMAQMRASNQLDLVYKRGQAGIVKASVTIVFDNEDKSTSPPGYEQHKEITITRQFVLPNITKWWLNGHRSQQNAILSLFQSVQLNINNPNFLIMQGRITKVLNMKPPEILGMVEEAAGTRMFEDRKDKARKTMAKKEKKIQEYTALLEEEVQPKLNKLRKDKREFMDYQKATTELDKLGRLLRAWEWKDFHSRAQRKDEEMVAKAEETKQIQSQKKKATKDIADADKQIASVKKRRDAELSKGGKLKALQDRASELGKKLTKLRTQAELKEGTINDEDTKIVEMQQDVQKLEKLYVEKEAQVQNISAAHARVKQEHEDLQKKLQSNEDLLQSLITGLGGNTNTKNQGGGYMGQLADARSRISQAKAEEEQARVKLGMAEKELAVLEARMKQFAKEANDNLKKLEGMRSAAAACEDKVKKSGWSTEQDQTLEVSLRNVREEVRHWTEQRDRVKSRIGRLNFDYDDPSPNFDRSKVKGLAVQLIQLAQENHDKAVALEIAAGGRLFNVVIEDEKVGTELIKHGRMRKRFTFIPLTKITTYPISDMKLNAAKKIAPGKVRTALSVIGCDAEVAKAMEYIFGGTLICDDSETAKSVTFDPAVRVRSVTLEGDSYDPDGTLGGGAPPSTTKIIIQVQELFEIERSLKAAQTKLAGLQREEEKTRNMRNSWKTLSRELEIKLHELKLLETQVGESNASLNASEVERVKATIEQLKQTVKDAQTKQKVGKDECAQLERDMQEFKNNKDGKIDELKATIAKQKAALQKHTSAVKNQQKEHQTAQLELEQTKTDIEGEKDKLEDAKEGVHKLHAELKKLVDETGLVEAAHAAADKELQEELSTLGRFDTELKELDQVIKEKKNFLTQADVTLQGIEHDLTQLKKDKTAAVNAIASLEKQYEWIQHDYKQFGKPGTMYDFTEADIPTLRQKTEELEQSSTRLHKKINHKVMNMIDTVEKREAELKKMVAIVDKDRLKIEATIEELDRYKRDALKKTWEKVSGDFGSIFAELLPGNFAKLQPPEGQDLMDGLEVKVQLGTVWKQSLTELSGGQRSLIALSLIMALLQFKPAPMYILDEIDAALDLSHTQHIGQLFRTRFKGSQFIVVSLKEGLFTNANVLFRARFRDGTSIVERTAQRSTSSLYNGQDENAEEGERNPRRRMRA